jgi:drug/metabolite transporter (DMT)-like permease
MDRTPRHSGRDSMTGNSKFVSHIWVTAALFAASIEPIIVKFGFMAKCTALQLLCVKSIVGAIVLLILNRKISWVGKSTFFKGVLPVSLLLLATNTLSILSLQYIEASLLISILTVTPAAVAVVNQYLGRDILSKKFWFGFSLCASGLLLTTGGSLGNLHVLGFLLALCAVTSSTVYRVLLEKQTTVNSPSLVSAYIYIINGICAFPLLFFLQKNPFPPSAYGMGTLMGITAALANLAFLWAISQLGSTRMSIIAMLQRPLIILISAFVLKEDLNAYQICGTVLILLGIYLARVKRRVSSTAESVDDSSEALATGKNLK